MSFKRLIVLLCLVMLSVGMAWADNTLHGIVTYLDNGQSGNPAIFDENQPVINVREGTTIRAGSTIITRDDNQMEVTLFMGDKPVGLLYISANTDISFLRDKTTGKLSLRVNYGRIRTVIEDFAPATVNLQTVEASLAGTDCGITVLTTEKGVSNGYFTVFGGTVVVTSLLDKNNREEATTWQEIHYQDTRVNPPYYWYEKDLLDWQSSMLYASQNIPSELDLILEYLIWPEETVVDVIEERIVDVTTDSGIKEKRRFDAKRFWSSLLSFEAGSIMYDGEIAIKIISRPGASFASDRFEFGLYLSASLIPSKAFTPDWNLHINDTNNEWSFGTDQGGSAPKIIWDVFDDLNKKLRLIRYNHPEDRAFFQLGDYFNISDSLDYSLVDFNSQIFYPRHRKTSLVTRFNLPWFEALIYAEDVMPKGLYGVDLAFQTPAKSFRFKYKLSAYLDAFNMMKFDGTESYFPIQATTSIFFEAFNLPSFGFNIFLNGGIMMPFTYNFTSGSSTYLDMLTANPSSLATGITGSTGFYLRFKDFSISSEFIVDSGLNKIGLFDTNYLAARQDQQTDLAAWISSKTSSSAISVSDYNFGFRIRAKYEYLDHIIIHHAYQMTVSVENDLSISASTFADNNYLEIGATSTGKVVYYDKHHFRITLDSKDKWKFNLAFFFEWDIQTLGLAFQSLTRFQLLNFMYMGIHFKPNFPTFKYVQFNLVAGIYPDYLTGVDPWHSRFIFDFYITLRPIKAGQVKVDSRTKKNL